MARSAVQARSNNHLLSALSASDFGLLKEGLTLVQLELRKMLEPSNTPIKHVYFPERGIVSVVAEDTRGRQSEVGLIGCEGMTGVHIVMGGDRSPHLSYVQAAGQGLRASADDIREAMRASGSLRENFLRFGQAFMTQTAHTAVANGRATIEERLARWILMAQDRVDGNDLMLTHEFLALMLNVRRAGVQKR